MRSVFLTTLISLTTLLSYGQVKVVLHSVVGYGQNEAFARKAAAALEHVLNSDEFKRKVLDTTFIKTKGYTNQQLYDRIIKAHEVQGEGGQDGVVDLRARTLRVDGDESNWKNNCEGSTLGIDGTGDGVTAVCPNKLQTWVTQNELNELAGHYAHEYMHILGFDHRNMLRGQKWREKTFVYVIGNIVSDLVEGEIVR
ncbi:hypothetical protein [Pedobacter psychrodurus]|uniref:hypothetical protein n=1 Tax=Pedobacter psychrodurus TaxID=2530456 RepID=UPI002931C64C|nr:hypothetical protein [Pedobacter psychrodurus]